MTEYQYDALGRLTSLKQPGGGTIRHEYDAAAAEEIAHGGCQWQPDDQFLRLGNLSLSITMDAQNRITYVGRLTEVASDTGDIMRFTYDANGNRLSHEDFDGGITSYQYDALNRQTGIMLPDQSVLRQDFNSLGLPLTATDNEGRITCREYDAMGRLTTVVSPDGRETEFQYDAFGNQLSVSDGNGNTTRYDYDVGRLIRETLPSGVSRTVVWNPDHTVAEQTDFNGNTTSFAYDLRRAS